MLYKFLGAVIREGGIVVTYGDVLRVRSKAELAFDAFGVESDAAKEFRRLFQNIGRAICEEMGVEFGKVVPDILPDMVLGHDAEVAYNALLAWLEEKGIKP